MTSDEMVTLIKGLYEAGVHATVSIDSNNNVEVDIEPPSLDIEVVPPFNWPQYIQPPSINNPHPYDPDFPSTSPPWTTYCEAVVEDMTPLFERRPDLFSDMKDMPPTPTLEDSPELNPHDFQCETVVCTDPDKMNGAADQFPGSDY